MALLKIKIPVIYIANPRIAGPDVGLGGFSFTYDNVDTGLTYDSTLFTYDQTIM